MTPRRSFILIAVLVVVASGLLITTSLLFMAQAEVATLTGAAQRAQGRALWWSGAQVVMGRLDQQRETILDGETPELEEEYVIYERNDLAGVVRLVSAGSDGQRAVPESSKLDLNQADVPMLTGTGWIDQTLATAIVAHRNRLGRPYQSVSELLDVEGVTPSVLYGPLEDLTVIDDSSLEEGDIIERVSERLGVSEPRGLADLLTTYAFEPALQRNGKRRINLNVPWSDELAERLDERFGEGASTVVKQIMDAGTSFDSEQVIFQVLNQFDTPVDQWSDILDSITTDDSHHFGRLDINTASSQCLRGLGLEAEEADQVLQVRDSLPAEQRATVAWPVIEGIIDRQRYNDIGARLTCRSWTYRIRLAAGERPIDEPDGPLNNPLVYEIVVDLSDPTARLAYVREITLLQTAAMVMLAESDELELEDAGFGEIDDPPSLSSDASEEETSEEESEDWSVVDDDWSTVDDQWSTVEDEWSTTSETETTQESSAETDDQTPATEASSPGSGKRVGRFRPG